MKRIICFLLIIMMVIFMASCKKESVLDLPDDTPLLTYDGEVLLDVSYFRKLHTEMLVSNDILGTDILSEKDLYKHQSEVLILSHIAKMYRIDSDIEEIALEYDDHMEEIKDEAMYPDELEYFTALREELSMSPSEFKDFIVNESYNDFNVTNVIDDISANYQMITDKDILLEYVQSNILEFIETSDVEVGFPGMRPENFDFMDVLEEH